jgi:Creatinine amidohydrolase
LLRPAEGCVREDVPKRRQNEVGRLVRCVNLSIPAHTVDYTGDVAAAARAHAPDRVAKVLHAAGDAATLGQVVRAGGTVAATLDATAEQLGRDDRPQVAARGSCPVLLPRKATRARREPPRSDPELVRDTFPGDHAGRYELSQLLYIRPDLVDMTRLDRVSSDPLGRFAQNPDASEATAAYGEQVIETQIARIGELTDQAGLGAPDLPTLTFEDVEPTWAAIERQRPSWVSYGSVSG